MEDNEMPSFESAIGRLKGYIADPKTVTPETLQELLTEIEGLQEVYEDEDTDEGEPEEKESGNPSLAIVIGKHMKKGGGEY